MERDKIVKEYFQLRNVLNRGNKLSNEATQFRFEIFHFEKSEYRFYAMVEGKSEDHRIILCIRDRSRAWEGAGFTQFQNLENYCAIELNKKEIEICNLMGSFVLTEAQMKLISERLKKVFDDLIM